MTHKTILGAAGLALLGVGALAQPQSEKPQGEKPATHSQPAAATAQAGACCHKASEVLGAKVRDAQLAEIGKVEDLVVDPATGRIEFAVLSLTARADKGQWFAVPFQALAAPKTMDMGKPVEAGSPTGDGRTPAGGTKDGTRDGAKDAMKGAPPEFTLSIDAAKLADAPGFAKGQWPDLNAAAWRAEIERHYGITPGTSTPRNGDVVASMHAARVSELLDRPLETTDGVSLGAIQELAIDAASARIAYAVVGAGGVLGAGEKLQAIPWEAVKVTPGTAGDKLDDYKLTVGLTKDRLAKAPEFKAEDWTRMSDRAWLGELYAYYGFRPYWSGATDTKARTPSGGTPPAEKGGKDPH